MVLDVLNNICKIYIKSTFYYNVNKLRKEFRSMKKFCSICNRNLIDIKERYCNICKDKISTRHSI